MNCLHRHVGELVGDIVVRMADRADLVRPDQLRVAGRKVELLVDDPLPRSGHDRELAEGDLTVTAVEFGHDAFLALRIAGHDRHAACEVETGEVAGNGLLHRVGVLVAPAGKIDEDRVHAAFAQDQRGVERAVRFADRTQEFARRREVVLAVEVAEAAQLHQVTQAVLDAVHALVDEVVRRCLIEPEFFERAGQPDHFVAGLFELVLPDPVAGCETRIDARLGGLLVFKQKGS